MDITIRDVAKKAGVAVSTVSRAFNGYLDISEDTKNRIFESAKELGYAPNVNARSLSSKSTNNIGLIVSNFLESDGKDNSVHLLLQGVYRYVQEHQLEMSLYAIDSQNQDKKPYVRFCIEHSLAGAVLSGITTKDTYFKELINSEIPCVLIDVHLKGKGLGCVSIDNIEAAGAITQYLLDHHHRNITVISGKQDASVTTERIAGIHEIYHKNGLKLSRKQIFHCDYSEEIAYRKVKTFLKTYKKGTTTAFLCLSDLMALGVMKAIQEMGYRIPDDFSVTGFDGIPISEYTHPGLTTIRQDFVKMGYEATSLLHEIIKDKDASRDVYVSYEIVERGSVKEADSSY